MAKTKIKVSDFVHLHNHSHYSLLDGLQKIPEMLDKIKHLGMEAVALTDHGTLSGAIEFYKGCIERGLKPIIGMEAYVASRKHSDKDPQKDRDRFHLILLAADNTGYQNLMRLSTIANLEGYYHRPRIDHDLLKKFNQGLIVLSGCMGGEVAEYLNRNQRDLAVKTAEWYKSVFGDRYYIELQDHGHKQAKQAELNQKLLDLADKLKIKVVVTGDAHYLNHEDQEAHEILLCVQTGSFLSDDDRMSLSGWPLEVNDPKEVIERWQDRPDVITNTKDIADRCQVDIDIGKILIPKFTTPKGEDEKSFLQKLVYRGLAWRYGNINMEASQKLTIKDAKAKLSQAILDRAQYELDVIDSMGFNGYFLIVWDFVDWGKSKEIVFGPGRGSAAGSIVAYGLRITEIDPLKYDLLFERFLNPDRISMPDIDIDIQDTRRDEVIDYVSSKYGSDRVANIVTFGKMAARNAVRDVARVLQVPYAESDRLAKMIPPPIQGRHIPLETSLQENQELKHEYQTNQQAKTVFDMATRLEGTIRSHGVHAAGVVIAPDDIVKFTPLEMAQKGVIATQYSMGPIDDIGLLKMDFLGLSNLTIIKNTLRIIKKVYGTDIDIDNLPLDDKKAYKLISAGDTTGIFQFESGGMKQYLKRLKPQNFEEIVAMGALYRPGPLSAGLTDTFIRRKNGQEKIAVPHQAFEKALASTYGTLVYQEQVMQISRDVCGFSGGESDTLRKAIGKKIREVMNKMEKRFIDGGVEHSGVPKPIMEKFWQDLLGFADYAFNKSHSVCYGLISYQTAYLKAHYPAAFMAALMTSDAGNTDRLSIEIAECQHQGIEVLPPDVNESFHEFAVVKAKQSIRFGLDAVKNVGYGPVEEILRARETGGPFVDINDFIARVSSSIVNRKAWESLIKAGAFDSLANRASLLNSLDDIIHVAQKHHKQAQTGQTDLFGGDQDDQTYVAKLQVTLVEGQEIPIREQLAWERELLGLYLSHHPLEDYKQFLNEKTIPLSTITADQDNQVVDIGGVIQDVRQITTKKGQAMAFVKLEDIDGERELVVFPGVMSDSIDLWQVDKVITVNGRVNVTDQNGTPQDEPKIIVNSATELTPEIASEIKLSTSDKVVSENNSKSNTNSKTNSDKLNKGDLKRLYIKLKNSKDGQQLSSIKKLLDVNNGQTEVVLVLGEEPNKQILRLPQLVVANKNLIKELRQIVGDEAVKLS